MIRRFPANVRIADDAAFALVVCALAAVITIVPMFLIHQACIAEILK
jgi:hypothetical protein